MGVDDRFRRLAGDADIRGPSPSAVGTGSGASRSAAIDGPRTYRSTAIDGVKERTAGGCIDATSAASSLLGARYL